MDHLLVMRKGGQEIDLNTRLPAVTLLEMTTSAPQINATYNSITGSDGQMLQSIAFGSSTLTASFLIEASNRSEFNLVKAKLQSELYARVPIRIRSKEHLGKAMWCVSNSNDIVPLDRSDDGLVSFTFTIISGMKETPFNSDELSQHTSELEFGMGFKDLDNLPSYSFNSNNFTLYNPSDIEIDPYIQHHQLNIMIQGVGSQIKMTNKTNGSSFTISNSISAYDTVTMSGISPYMNQTYNHLSTDYGHIVLAKGNNDIEVTGLAVSNITFSFPFLYF